MKLQSGRCDRPAANSFSFTKKALCNIGVLNDRTHRKLAVIDGHEALVGSHCVAEHWLGDAQDKDH